MGGAAGLARVRDAARAGALLREVRIPLARPLLGAEEEQAVLDVLRSGQLSLGPRLPEFERAFADRLGVAEACAVSSGTTGLHLALRAAGVEAGTEVVTSPFSFVASANAIIYQKARPVFVDIDPVTLNAPAAAMRAAVTERTSAFLPVHIFGVPAETPELEAAGLPIVEDACEALGAVHPDGVPVGGRGHPAVFGFYANKQITTGEGGMIALGDPSVAEAIRSERNQGRAPDMGWLDHDRLGFNYRLGEVACALGLVQLRRLEDLLAGRVRVASRYGEALADVEGLTVAPDLPGRSWFVYVVQLPRGVDRDATVRALRERGVDSKPYLPAIHLLSFYRERFGHRAGELPVCEDVAARSIALPFHPELPDRDIAVVSEALRDIITA